MCVSTVRPGTSKQLPSTTFAVLRATPRSVVSSSSVRGTSPPKRLTMSCAVDWIDFAFCRKKPVGRTSASTSAGSAAASFSGVPQRRNSSGVTRFTIASVHCADRIVATSSWKGVSKWSAHVRIRVGAREPAHDARGAALPFLAALARHGRAG